MFLLKNEVSNEKILFTLRLTNLLVNYSVSLRLKSVNPSDRLFKPDFLENEESHKYIFSFIFDLFFHAEYFSHLCNAL